MPGEIILATWNVERASDGSLYVIETIDKRVVKYGPVPADKVDQLLGELKKVIAMAALIRVPWQFERRSFIEEIASELTDTMHYPR